MKFVYSILFACSMFFSFHAKAERLAIPPGSYLGRVAQDHHKIHLVIRSFESCNSCFIALIMKDGKDDEVYAYKGVAINQVEVDHENTSSVYTLTPFFRNDDRTLGLTYDPSLVISVFRDPMTFEVAFSIVSASSDHPVGFQAGMLFSKGKSSSFEISDPEEGEYRIKSGRIETRAVISLGASRAEDQSRSGRMTWFGSERPGFRNGGEYGLIENFPDVFSLNGHQFLSSGEKENDVDYLVFFLKKRSKRIVMMVDPASPGNILSLIKKTD